MKNNKGFSLVELIIVIAIMAILVGVMAPQLIKYIEKSKVSSDTQLLDTWHTAIVTSMMDPAVLSEDDNSQTQIDHFQSAGSSGVWLSSIGGDTAFCRSILSIVGEPETANLQAIANNMSTQFRSKAAHANGGIIVACEGSTIYMWIQHSDRTGAGEDNTCNNIADLESSGVIYVK